MIELKFSEQSFSITSDIDKRFLPVELSDNENSAIDLIYEFLHQVNVNLNDIHLERRAMDYLSIILYENCDFCRIHLGPKSKWFSVQTFPELYEKLDTDPRLLDIKNPKIRHWKFKISDVNDLKNFADIIQKACLLDYKSKKI